MTSKRRNKNILLITHLYYPSIGGAEKVFQSWAEALYKNGYNLTVLTTDALSTEDYFKDKTNNLKRNEVINGVDIYRFTINSKSFQISKYLWKAVNKYSFSRHSVGPLFFGPHFFPIPSYILNKTIDYVVAGPCPTSNPFYGLFISKKMKIPFYLFPFIHTDDNLHTSKVNKIVFKLADKIITTTPSETSYFQELGIEKSKIFETINPIDDQLLKVRKVQSKLRLPEKYVLYLGQEGRHKNIPLLINAMVDLWNKGKSQSLVIAGNRTDFSVELDNIISDVNKRYSNRIFRFNNITDEQKIELIDNSLLLVNPSFHESFGLVFLEAWARKKTVIGNDIDAVRNVIDNRKNGLIFEYNDIKDLAKKLKSLIENERIRGKYAEAGNSKLLKRYLINSIDFDQLFLGK